MGLDASVARAAVLLLTERCIDVQYYLYRNDLVGKPLTHALIQAADRVGRSITEKKVRPMFEQLRAAFKD